MRKTLFNIIVLVMALTSLYPAFCFGQNRRERFAPVGGGTPIPLGITISDVPRNSQIMGALVTNVEAGGIGEKAGLMYGDIIVIIAGNRISSVADAGKYMRIIAMSNNMGKTTDIGIVRDGQEMTLSTAGGGAQQKGPWLGIGMKDAPRDWGVEGVLATDVAAESPAYQAGILAGDIITGINGLPVRSVSDLQKVLSVITTGQIFKVTVRRGGQSNDISVEAQEKPAAGVVSSSAKRRLSDINILKYAFIDPQSRSVILVGKYDPDYKTGPIPYYELLNDAISSPYPWFSLEPTQETLNNVNVINNAVEADVKRMYSQPNYSIEWATRLLGMFLNDPALKKDRARFISKGASAFGITAQEMEKVLAKSANASSVSEDEMMPILGKVLMGLGYNQVGSALLSNSDGSGMAFEHLGISAEKDAIVSRFNSGAITKDRASIELTVLMVSAVLRGLNVPESSFSSKANSVLNGRTDPAELMKFMEDSLTAILADSVGLKLFNGLTLSHEVFSKLYNVPPPRMNLVFKGVPADSVLGDTLFRADYALKSICTSPEVKDSVPGFLTEMEYIYEESQKYGVRVPADAGAEVGHRLIPGEVRMNVSPEGTLVSFDDAQIKIIGWVMSSVGKKTSATVTDFIKNSTEGYADYLTRHYDELAKVFPELHKLREAEKLIALARWAKANNYSLVADRAAGIRLTQSPTAIGFMQGVFTADANEFSLTVIAEGGAAFDEEEGEAWIKPTPNVEITGNTLQQLAASQSFASQAALAANSGDFEEARDLADKSARAMTGEIDMTQLPSLDIPMPGEPAQAAALSVETLSTVDENLRAIENAKITMEKAASLEATSPMDADKLREYANQQQQQAEKHLRDLKEALDTVRKEPARIGEMTVAISNINSWPTTAGSPKPGSSQTPGASAGNVSAPAAPAKPKTSKSREELKAELDKLEQELDTAKAQLAKLNQQIMQDQTRFLEWQGVAENGMNKCADILSGLLVDAAAGKMLDRYTQMHELSKKLPDQPEALIKRLGRTKEMLIALKGLKSFKDVKDWAYANGDTLPEALEKIRDGITLITGLKGWDKTLVGAAWTYGSNIVDLAYSYTQYSATYDAVKQQDQTNEGSKKALESLKGKMAELYSRTKEVKQQLSDMSADENFD